MDINLIFRIAAVGILVSVLGQVLKHSGREEQATLVSITGIVIVLVMIMGQLSQLITTVKTVFGL